MTMARMKYLSALFFFACVFSPCLSVAQSEESKALPLVAPQNMISEYAQKAHLGDCAGAFNDLWTPFWNHDPLAVEALLFLLHFEPFLRLPGRSRDYVTTQRDLIILIAHTDKIDDQELEELFVTPFNILKGGQEYLECRNVGKGRDCGAILSEDRIIPTPEEFKTEIDTFQNAGFTATCRMIRK